MDEEKEVRDSVREITNKQLDTGLIGPELANPTDSKTAYKLVKKARFQPGDQVIFYPPGLNCGHPDDRFFANVNRQIFLGGIPAQVVIVQDVPGKQIGVVAQKPFDLLTSQHVKGHTLDQLCPDGYGLWVTEDMLLTMEECEARTKYWQQQMKAERSPERRQAMALAEEFIGSVNRRLRQES